MKRIPFLQCCGGVVLWTGCLLFFLVAALVSARATSPTVDEFAHVPAGCYYTRTGDFSLFAKNPPLARVLVAAPLVFDPPDLSLLPSGPPSGWRPWLYATDFMRRNAERIPGIYFLARVPVVLVGCLFALVLGLVARRLYGGRGALLTLALFCLDPTLLAHFSLATVDGTATCFLFLTIASFFFFLQQPTWGRSLVVGGLLGCALLSKFTGVLLVLALPLMLGLDLLLRRRDSDREGSGSGSGETGRRVGGLAAAFGVGLVVLNAGYLFSGSFSTLEGLDPKSGFVRGLVESGLGGLPLPVPRDYLDGFDRLKLDLEAGEFPAYLLGEWSPTGFLAFFPVALALKLSIPLLLLTGAGLISFVVRPRLPGGARREWILLVPFLGLGLMMVLFSRVNYGVRYVLFLVPVFALVAGRVVAVAGPRRPLLVALTVLVSWNLVGTIRVSPHYLSSVNELAGGENRAPLHLLDSNLDWGQDLPALRDLQSEKGLGAIDLAYFGHVAPGIYGIDWRPAPLTGAPPPRKDGWLAVSANFVHGYAYVVLKQDLSGLRPVPADAFRYLRDRTPDARAGRSLYLYRNERLHD